VATLDALYITVDGRTERLTSPEALERAIREIVRLEVREMQDEGVLPSHFDRGED
jgi:hypothetical protein